MTCFSLFLSFLFICHNCCCEPWSSGVGCDHSAKCATITDQFKTTLSLFFVRVFDASFNQQFLAAFGFELVTLGLDDFLLPNCLLCQRR